MWKEKFSYTKIDTFQHCPFKYKLRYIKRIEENLENNVAMHRGSLAHLVLERKVNGETDLQDPELTELLLKLSKEDTMKILKSVKKFINGDFFQALDLSNGVAEQMFHLDEDLNPCIKTKAFISGKIDYREIKEEYVLIIDWKTGKKTLKEIQLYKKNDLQLDLYALWALQKFDDIANVHAMLYYIESNVADEKLYDRRDIPQLKAKIMENIDAIRGTDTFERNMGPLCDYCAYFSDYCNMGV